MSEVLEMLAGLFFDVICAVVEAFAGDFTLPDTKAGRIILCVIIVLLGVVIWWELR